MDNVTFADAFADRAHAGQVRKGGDVPYITHPREVASLLRQHYPKSGDLEVAGLLHDVLEDTPVPFEALRALFGSRVAALVWQVTNTRPDYDLSQAEPDALRLKAADLLANIIETQRDIEAGHYVWARFAAGRRKVNTWDRQTSIIESRLLHPLAVAQLARAHNDDRDLVERLRARVDTMQGLVTIVTDAERAALLDEGTVLVGKAPPIDLKG